jgi:hypothetical protein
MKQQRHQSGLGRLTHRITKLENEVHQAMAVMDKDMGKLLNYRKLMNSQKSDVSCPAFEFIYMLF